MCVKNHVFVVAVSVLLAGNTSAWGIEGPGKFLKNLLQFSEPAEEETRSARLAQSRGPSVVPRGAAADTRRLQAEANRARTHIERQLSSLQRQLDLEQQRLESQVAQYAKQKQAAVAQGDQPKLKRIEASEAAAVKRYEQRVERILAAAASPKETPAARPSPPKSRQQAAGGRQSASKATKAPPAPAKQPPRRRKRLWPFR